jgi:Tol biopolymer transport system component
VVNWAGENLLYTAMIAGQMGTMRLAPAAGGTPHQLLPLGRFPSATADGHTIVFQGDGLWKVDGEGRNPARLSGDGFAPQISPNARYVVFLSSQSGLQSPWVLATAGGPATQVTNSLVASVLSIDISPDSASLVFSSIDSRGQRILVLCSLPTCTNRSIIALASGGVGRLRWTLDGRGVAFIDAAGSNIWVQPVDGGHPSQLTRFDDGRSITDFAWSRNGERLAVTRGSASSDIVLFKGLRR